MNTNTSENKTNTSENKTNETLTKTQYGQFMVLSNDHIGKKFIAGVHYEHNELQFLLKYVIMPGNMIIDVGANIGAHTIPYAKAVGKIGKVFAFEPQSVIRELLLQNIQLNDVREQVTVLDNAVGHKNCHTTLNCNDDEGNPLDYECKRANFGGLNLGKDGEPVAMITLDSIRHIFTQKIKYIKIDVEGAESLVIHGARRLIEDFRPFVFFEHNYKTLTKDMVKMYNLSANIVNFNIFDFFLKELGYERIIKMGNNYLAIPTNIVN